MSADDNNTVEIRRTDRRNLILIGLAVIAVLAIVGFGLKSLMGGASGPKKPPKISLIPTTPPPPPPPPPKEEKRPEPPKEQKEMKMAQEEKQDQPPADPSLKMEGAAGDGPSMFSAGKVTNDDLSNVGTGSGGGSLVNPFNVYAQSIKSELQRQLSRRAELKRRPYKIEVLLWVAEDGRVKRYELMGTSKDEDTDDAIRSVLGALPAFSEPPPVKMPQPIKLRIVAGGRL